jgi:tetratricopeptide (TPR) repeat protein
VVASGVLDGLQKLQDATRSTDKSLNTTSAWSSDVKIEVPETGVSIGEINRLLHQRFGHDLHIDGDLVQTESGGLALTVRGDGVPAKTFDGAAGDLDKLTTQAAEYIYGRSQPVQYAIYLEGVDRNADALAFIPAAYARADGDEARAKLAHRWANAYAGLNQSAKAAEKQRLAMSLAKPNSPEWWANYSNRVGSITAAEGEETGWRESHAFLSAVQAAPKSQRPPTRLLENVAEDLWDLPLFLASNLADAQSHNGAGTSTAILGPSVADTYALMHDPAQATRLLTASDPDDSITKAEALLLEGYAALDRGDAAAAVPPLEAFYKAWLADPNLQFTYSDQPCFLGLAYGLVGRMADAEPVFKKPGAWSRCYAFHGDALAHAGDGAGAERVWAEGLKIAPDLPQVYLHRGVYELDHGDLKAAEADLSTAAAKAPHYADPRKAWGDVLAKQGRWKEALAKYDEALKYAPAWAELHRARDAAARKG